MSWWLQPVKALDLQAQQGALDHQLQLTKPEGALGQLETLAVQFATWQSSQKPTLERINICVFAADHGVAEEAVSAFPQVVTQQMIANFSADGAAICVLAKSLSAQLCVVNLGTVDEMPKLSKVLSKRLGAGTRNFCKTEAMTESQLDQALLCGQQQINHHNQLFIAGEMGIGNTTSTAALVAALLNCSVQDAVGLGTGLDTEGVVHKQEVVGRALVLHQQSLNQPLSILRCLGGFEIAAMVGAYIAAAQRGVPCVVDGYISSAAALLACRLNPGVQKWLIFSHQSAEPGHRLVLAALQVKPLLDLGLRLGEASGAALVVPLLRQACLLHGEMSTFTEAGVSQSHG